MATGPVVVVLASDVSLTESLSQRINQEGFTALTCPTVEDLHRIMNGQRVDALVIEDNLPGFFKGSELVERMQHELIQPVVVLLAEPTKEVKARAQTLKIGSIMVPGTDPNTICDTIKILLRTAAPSSVPLPVVARQMVQRAPAIQPLPQLVVRLAGYLHSSEASLAAVARDIATDPKATADLLRYANSAAFGRNAKLTGIQEAVTHLGIRRTAALLIAAALRTAEAGLSRAVPAALREGLQFRSVLVAHVASAFAHRIKATLTETAHVVGLMQELGILVMLAEYGDEYQGLLNRARTVRQLYLPLLETQQFGHTHAHVSAALMQKWQLPQSLIRIVAHHHDTKFDEQLCATERDVLTALRIADAFADFRDAPCPQRHQRLVKALSQFAEVDSAICRESIQAGIKSARESARIFAVPVPGEDDWQNLVGQIRVDVEADPEASVVEWVPDDARSDTAEPSPVIPTRIVVVDDDAGICRLMQAYLETSGFEVVATSDFELAREAAREAAAVVCDVHLAGQDGLALVQRLRDSGFTRPILIMSGDRRRETVTRCIDAGVADYLPKPFAMPAILQKLNRWGIVAPDRPPRVAPDGNAQDAENV